MSKPLIYLIAIFALWLYFRYGNFETSGKFTGSGKYTGSGLGGGVNRGGGAGRVVG